MENKRFLQLTYIALVGGILLLAGLQFNSVTNIHRLLVGNRKMAYELRDTGRLRQSERDSLLLSQAMISQSARKAQRWGILLIGIILIGGAAGFLYIIKKIRQQQALIRLLDASEKKVRETSKIKENFLANMSHEIRTPMNALLGFSHLLTQKELDAESAHFVGAIHQSVEKLLVIVDDILDLSKIEAGMIRIESAPFTIRENIQYVAGLFTEKTREKGISLRTEVSASVPEIVTGDAARLTQVLVNLVGNAVKFTEQGSINVAVSAKERTETDILLNIRVTDTGIGIDIRQQAAIFDRFQQAEDSITRTYGGTGLGLTIVRQLVELQGGQISVESAPGKGSKFTIVLPYKLPAAKPQTEKPVETAPSQGAAHLLIVEDNAMNRDLLRFVLARWQLSFDMAENGRQALEKLQSAKYHLILMDLQMPVLDGYSTAVEIRQKLHLSTPIIAMTAHAFPEERAKCLQYGIDDYIAKPIKEKELHDLITKFTRRETPFAFIDTSYIRSISRGDTTYERAATELFIRSTPEYLRTLKQACDTQNMILLQQTVHSMRTTVSTLGVRGIDELLDQLEFGSENERLCRDGIAAVESVCLAAIKDATQWLAQLNKT